MDEKMFQHLIANQSKWAAEYAVQEKVRRVKRKEFVKSQDWYGNTAEYKKEWDKNNNRKKMQN
jgi:hypothetical protein